MAELTKLKSTVEPYRAIASRIEDLEVLAELIRESGDEAEQENFEQELRRVVSELDSFEMQTFLSGPHDDSNAILEVNAGAGGTESCDWAAMLLRMYTRWAERKGYQVEVLNEVEGEVAGIRNATILVKGPLAYGYLKVERGVHRLVRISPFDANARRHTSFASVDVVPELTEGPEIEINPDDLRVDTYRSSGAGGQHVNKTDSAVRITHIPTGIVVSCQDERSQIQNREKAMRMLRAHLLERQRREQEEAMASSRRMMVGSGDRSEKIRTYNFPQGRVTDHRIGMTVYNLQEFLDGDIQEMLDALVRHDQARRLAAGEAGDE